MPTTINGTSGGDTLNGTGGDDVINGLDGNDSLSGGEGDDILNGGTGFDTLDGGNGSDTASYSTAAGGMTVNLLGYVDGPDGMDNLISIENIIGSAFQDNLIGDAGDNTINGGDGDDQIFGGDGNDKLYGGNGNDFLSEEYYSSQLISNDLYDGGAGFDTFQVGSVTSGITIDLRLDGVAQDTGGGGIDTFVSIENIVATSFNDVLTGNDLANVFTDFGGSDQLTGNGGDDTFILGSGTKVIDGGTGSDSVGFTYFASGPNSRIVLSLAIEGSAQSVLLGSTDTISVTLTSVENASGSGGNDQLTGNALANVLTGYSGNDTLMGAAGDDTLIGDGPAFDASVGNDNLDGGVGNDHLIGGYGDDILDGGADNDWLEGGAGNDILIGSAGTDALDGGAGIDMASYSTATGAVQLNMATGDGTDTLIGIEGLIGSNFNDTLTGDAADNILEGGLGNDTINGGMGSDTASYAGATSAVTVSLAIAGAQNTVAEGSDTLVSIENLSGSAFNDHLTGNAGANILTGGLGNDTLDGGGGPDTLVGGLGNDTYVTDGLDTIVENSSEGTDTIQSSVDFSLTGNLIYVENLTLVGSALNGTGNPFNNTITGNANANVLDGSSGNDNLSGGAGDDLLIGGLGDDFLDGGAGNDTISYAGIIGGVTVDLSGPQNTGPGGVDAIFNVENITGGSFDDHLTGDLGANVLAGADGWDTLTGAAGDDTLDGGAGNDLMAGGDGADHLIGGYGNDTLTGGNGNDLMTGGRGADTFVFAAASGSDTITDFQSTEDVLDLTAYGYNTLDEALAHSHQDGSNIVIDLGGGQTLTLQGGLGTNAIYGTAFSDYLVGTSSGEQINGYEGDDTIIGGDGNDIIDGGDGNDVIDAGAGDDTVYGSNGTDTITDGPGSDSIYGEGGGDWIIASPGAGSDYYDAGPSALESTIDYSHALAGIVLNLGTGTAQSAGGADAAGIGVDQLANFDFVHGTAFDDSLTGDSGDNRLYGGGGNDVFDGGGGDDALYAEGGRFATADGGTGDDVIFLNLVTTSASDVTTAHGGTGVDSVVLNASGSGSVVIDTAESILLLGTTSGGTTINLNNPVEGVASGISFYVDWFEGATFGPITLNGFDAGIQGGLGDSFDAGDYAAGMLQGLGYDTRMSPFDSGLMRLVQVGPDTVVQAMQANGTFANVATITNILVGNFDPRNFFSSTMIAANWGLNLTPGQTISGDSSDNSLVGGDGRDTISGGAGNDTLNGGRESDTLTGGAGADTFVIARYRNVFGNPADRAGSDTITDFNIAQDKIDLGDYGFYFFGDILSRAHQVGANVVIDLGPTEHLTINNVQLGSLTVANFTGVTSGSGMAVLPPPEPANPTVYRQFKADYADIVIAAGVTQYGLMSNGIYETSDLVTPINSFTNNGTLWASGNDAVSAVHAYGAGALVNNGTIYSVASSGDAWGFHFDGGFGSFNNSGTLAVVSWFSRAIGIETYDSRSSILNSGTISVRGDFDAYAIVYYNGVEPRNTGDTPITNTATGKILAEGPGAVAIYLAGALSEASNNPTINNAGLIAAHSLSGDASVAILNTADHFGGTINILNSGTISGDFAYYAVPSASIITNLTNQAGGQIFGAISLAHYDDKIINAGTIVGDIFLDDGNDLYNGTNGSLNGVVDAGGGNDTVIGWADPDTFYGDDGDDTLTGNGGDDFLEGGAGNDKLSGGAGFDVASYSEATAGVTVNLGLASAQNTVGAGTDTLSSIEDAIGSAFGDQLTGNSSSNYLFGLEGNDRLDGLSGSDVLDGGDGDDTLFGRDGNDTLGGGAGYDRMYGGLGDDTYYANDSTDYAYENAGEGQDRVIASIDCQLRDNVEDLSLTGAAYIGKGNVLDNSIIGSGGANKLYGYEGSDYLDGAGGDDYLFGADGNDTLIGGAGYDRMYGGVGDDAYYVSDTTDFAYENAGEGNDTVFSSLVSYQLRANIEELDLVEGSAAVRGYGQDDNNTIVGNSADNFLYGRDGNDLIKGNGGADILYGENGNDTLIGGAGMDRFYGGAGADKFTFRDGDFAGMTSSTADRIHDFDSAQGDKIHLSGVDSNSLLAGDQNFSFIGSAAFSHIAGELRAYQSVGNTYVAGDLDGDGVADFVIRVDGLHNLQASDFVL